MLKKFSFLGKCCIRLPTNTKYIYKRSTTSSSKMKSILLVEDNPLFAAAATNYLKAQPHTALYHAKDYDGAMRILHEQPGLDAAFIDCFFPKAQGSNDITLGTSLVSRLAESDSHEKKIKSSLESLEKYVNLEDAEIARYARLYLGTSEYDFIPQNAIIVTLKVVGSISKGISSALAKTYMKRHEDKRSKDEFHPYGDYYGKLLEAMSQSEANQPLGILIAEQAVEKKIPFVMTTSTYHHDMITQPLLNYIRANDWTFHDCLPKKKDWKSSNEFWAVAAGRLHEPKNTRS